MFYHFPCFFDGCSKKMLDSQYQSQVLSLHHYHLDWYEQVRFQIQAQFHSHFLTVPGVFLPINFLTFLHRNH
jgi:hypothetical protein